MHKTSERTMADFRRNQQFLLAHPALNPYLIRLLIHVCKRQFIAGSGTAGTASEREATSELCVLVKWIGNELNF